MQNKREQILGAIVILLLLILVGMAVFRQMNPNPNKAQTTSANPTAQNQDNPTVSTLPPASDTIVAGVVKKAEGTTVTLTTSTTSANATAPSVSDLTVDASAAQIYKFVPKAVDVVQKEQADFQKQMQTKVNPDPSKVVPPAPFEKQPIKVSDLSVGMPVIVTTVDSVTNQQSVKAVEIDVNPSIPASASAPTPTPVKQ